ncbi:heparinase II/III family protein [Mycolicibacterium komossense]|uniref:Alginate lyase family protein n=1 Tax=Mycolicibacterium komossense TaxID=1779 RepID=A0ABT3CDG9_9MYCO|nr:alginate lyase family protein [Mycolicibacterium komossense]MCV7227512.1 alginate lyase family protein [Mycolicibacterium komossense]
MATGPKDWAAALKLFRDGTERPVLLDREQAQRISEEHPDYVADLVSEADRVADLCFRFPGYPEVSLSRPIDWNYEPITGQLLPTRPSDRINFRTLPGKMGLMWRLHRLQHLPWLAQAWLFTNDDRYCAAAFEQLDSWIDQNPPGHGIAWSGAMETGLRAIAITIAMQGLRDAPQLTPERFRRVVDVLSESARRCWEDRSRFSSANNHLIGEMAGLAVVAIMFPELRESRKWERSAIEVLSNEAGKQVLADGAAAEQSICYQLYTVELLHLVTALLIGRDGSAPVPLVEALGRSCSFLAALAGKGDPAPRYGDDDEGFALRLGVQPARTVHDHLGIVATSGRCAAQIDAGRDSLDAQWFRALAQSGSTSNRLLSSAEPDFARAPSFVAPHGGLVVLRNENRRITMDVGPLGYLSTAAHGHADALAVTLSEAGEDLIGDPGTGSYYGHPGWRTVVRGTRAHSTVCVDGQDQSVVAGPYLWLQHAGVEILGIDLEAGVVDARHDGYARLRDTVIHRRWLIAPPNERSQLIIDLITGKGSHSCEQNWPLHPSLDVVPVSDGHIASCRGSEALRFHYAATQPLTVSAVRGDEESNRGWWSDPAEGRTPAWWLSANCLSELPVVMVALISSDEGDINESLSVKSLKSQIVVQWVDGERSRNAVVDIDKPASVLLG